MPKSLPATAPPPRRLERRDQLRLRFDGERKRAMTVAELARETAEDELYVDILTALNAHPEVALAYRQTLNCEGWLHPRGGGARFYVRLGYKGLPDIGGFLRDGRTLQIEIKRPGERPDPHQALILAIVRRYGGVAGTVHSVAEALALVDAHT